MENGCSSGSGRVCRVYRGACLSVCLSGCLSVCFFRTASQKPMQLGSPNLTLKCFAMNHGNIFGSRDHR